MYSLKKHNTFGFDIKCEHFVEFRSEEELSTLGQHHFAMPSRNENHETPHTTPHFVIGSGSNLLFRGDYKGTILHSAIKGIQINEKPSTPCEKPQHAHTPAAQPSPFVLLRCGSGETMDHVIAYAIEHGLYGAENLSGIPGEVGASAIQNIGAYGAEAKDIIHEVRAYDMQTAEFVNIPAADCHFRYRGSRFKDDWAGRFIITYVTYRLSTSFKPHLDYGNIRAMLSEQHIAEHNLTAQQLRDLILHIRHNKLPDPQELGSAGSFFMNPVVSHEQYLKLKHLYPDIPSYPVGSGTATQPSEHNPTCEAPQPPKKIPAAWLIDKAGWKGRSLGRAAVHKNQPLVLVNTGGATPDELLTLCHAIQADVQKLFSILLTPEVVMV